MEKIIVIALIITTACSLPTKHISIKEELTWSDAWKYCRSNFTDFSSISSELEDQVFRRYVGESVSGWIGLFWNSSRAKWTWTGGEEVTNTKWVDGNPETSENAYWTPEEWKPHDGSNKKTFFCLNLIVVKERKLTWEEASEYCRKYHTHLTSLLSKTETILAQAKIQNDSITEGVWIGLRYLGNRWLWVNDDPLVYKAWPQGENLVYQCPLWNRCGVLTKKGQWENWNCEKKLNFICI